LLADLAHQAGIAVHAVRLTTDLQRLTNELQHSRTQIVTARVEERRRLRRDLHDGLGSVLASLNWRAGALRLVLSRDPVAAAAVEVAAYRIVQEALTNVVRHARAHRCCICLSCENDLLHVEVSDDGVGLPESSRAGVGLLSMRERAAELGGTCEIAPMPEGGTCVRACLPLVKDDH
jgi:signal transduction histidine kinase